MATKATKATPKPRTKQVSASVLLTGDQLRTVGDLVRRLMCFNPDLPVLRETEEFGASGIEDCFLIDDDDGAAFVFIGPRDSEED